MNGDSDEAVLRRLGDAVTRIAAGTRSRPMTGRSHEDADEVVGTFGTDTAIGFDPFPLLHAFCRHNADVVVMGQVAGILHGSTELTGDLDLLWDGQGRDAMRMASVFRAVGAAIATADGAPLSCTAEAFYLPKVLFTAPSASGDCCTPALPWGELDIAGIIQRSEVARARSGLAIRYVSATDLIAMRRAAGRPKDHRRAIELERLTSARP